MKLAKLTLALSAVLAAPAFAAYTTDVTSGVPAGNIFYMAGASALSGTVGLLADGACNSPTTKYKDDTDGKQAIAYVCSAGAKSGYGFAAGSPFILVKRDKDGSFAGVGPVVNPGTDAAGATTGGLDFPDLTKCDTTALKCAFGQQNVVQENGSLGTPGASGFPAATKVPHAGLTDVDSNIWRGRGQFVPTPAAIATGWTTVATFANQGFGVAVSDSLYAALQTAQGLTGCAGNFTPGACQPSISKAQYASIAAQSGGYHTDWSPILGTAGAGKAVNLCRRVPTSGTQASSDVYFLESPCAKADPNNGFLIPATAADTVSNQFVVTEGSSTGNVKSCLTNASTAGDFAIGVASLENKPGTSDKWHFVKLDGVSPNLDANQKQATINGDYTFAYEQEALWRNDLDATRVAFMNALITKLADPNLSNLVGLAQVPGTFAHADFPTQVSKGTRFGNACQPFQLF